MAPPPGDQWVKDYEKAKKTAQQIARDVDCNGSGKLDPKQAALLRGSMVSLKQDVTHLQQSLMRMSQNTEAYNVTRKELARRGDMLAELSDTSENLQEAVRSGARRRIDAAAQNAPWREERPQAPDANFCADQELLQQDETLDFLHGTVKNLKNMGGGISQEIDLHCRLLGELEDQTDDSTGKIQKQQRDLKRLSTDQSPSCSLYCYICVMAGLLFVLIFFF
mmetsp:Transcript_97076/g.153045  ORF Transcript_97076/g.153045 Transcript_97076/m.153045 type:complete len:222 (-) Transcript_97076:49-714(-)